LLAVRLLTEIERRFSISMPLSVLYNAPTAIQLSAVIEKNELPQHWDTLVEVQPHGKKTPLFFIHSELGTAIEYDNLSKRLGLDQPLYALQPQNIFEENVRYNSIEDMALKYLKEIKRVQPKGPYYLGGYCLGGLIGYEIARLMETRGEKVVFLGLISTTTPEFIRTFWGNMSNEQKIFHKVKERVEFEFDNLSVLSANDKISYLSDRIKRLLVLSKVKVERIAADTSEFLKVGKIRHSNIYNYERMRYFLNLSFMEYMPIKINAHITLFRPGKQNFSQGSDATLGWQKITESKIDVYEIPCFHKNIMKEPAVGHLAEKLIEHFDRISRARTS